jgi:hypothetical protein
MWIFTVDKTSLQSSLAGTMQFLFVESSKTLQNWKELIPFTIPKF